MYDDTIAAIASPPGGSLRGIVRLSGPEVVRCVDSVFVCDDAVALGDVRGARVFSGKLAIDGAGARLDCDLYLWPTERSYTRQPMAELHTIGSPPLLEIVLRSLCGVNARLASPGEFTLRAFLAGRLDLTQAEAVLGVIDAENDRQFQVALRQLAGGLAAPFGELRESLLQLLAHLEAGLDFAEEDIEFITPEQLDGQLASADTIIDGIVEQMATRGRSDGLIRIVLAGWPNVGKSSLLNALAGRTAALVSETAGTTRDYVSLPIDVGGAQCQLIDTAGITDDDGSGEVGRAAQRMTAEQCEQADFQLLCLDATRPLNAWERGELEASPTISRLLVQTKSDLAGSNETICDVATSSKTGAGLDALRRKIEKTVATAAGDEGSWVVSTATRCREGLRGAAESLSGARRLVASGAGEELVAAELRVALDELGQVVGAVYTDDVLDRIFSRFCIGK